ncbi:MAG: DUF6503 family protein [Bacteroidota bacterium]
MKLFTLSILLLGLLFVACSINPKASNQNKGPFAKTIKKHGGDAYDNASIAFDFREGTYTFKNEEGKFRYTVQKEKDGQIIFDVLTNDSFVRKVDGEVQDLSPKDALKYGNSLNSVIYFAQLPYKLDDPAVKKTARGTTTIKGQPYRVVEVSFAEEGGGTDHDDIYYYWINQKTDLIDYLAYNFHVNGSGVRFRSAYNPRRVGEIHFQDYVNYKADKDTPLSDLPALYEKGELKELSKIELEGVRVLP